MSTYFNAEVAAELSAEDVQDYPLPFRPDVLVRCASVPVSRMKQYSDAQQKGGSVAANEQYRLVSESIVDEHGERVYKTPDQVRGMARGRTRLFMALVKIVAEHNGANDEISPLEAAEKNSDLTAFEGSPSDSV